MDKQQIINNLIEKELKIAVAESCTGGLLAKTITDIPGSSACFDVGLVTYSNESKVNLLDVSPQTLEKYGAVSKQVAIEMINGLRKISDCDIAISITGIAGPGGATENKPIGLVYIAINDEVYTCNFKGTRQEVREQTVDFVFAELSNL